MNTKNCTDEELIHALRRGDPERRKAWEYIYKNWRGAWVGPVVQRGGTPDEADDALGDVAIPFQQAVSADGFQLDRAILRTYLVKCILRAWAKRKGKEPPAFDPLDEVSFIALVETVEQNIMHAEIKTAVDELINTLKERCRRVLRMFGEGVRMEKIAAAEGLKDADKAKKEKYECLTKLKEYLRDNPVLANRLKELLHD